nr:MAG TPA: hypothetical protein [Caudoviricetes sp.]
MAASLTTSRTRQGSKAPPQPLPHPGEGVKWGSPPLGGKNEEGRMKRGE